MTDASKSPPADINPYESPAGAGGYRRDADRGVGVWRERDLVVIHKDAKLPAICVETGEPTTYYEPFQLLRSFSTRRMWLAVPRSNADVRFSLRWRSRIQVALTLWLAVALIFALTSAFFRSVLSPLLALVFLATSIGVHVAYLITSHFLFQCPLTIVRARENYFWLSGAGPRFLEQLPEWDTDR